MGVRELPSSGGQKSGVINESLALKVRHSLTHLARRPLYTSVSTSATDSQAVSHVRLQHCRAQRLGLVARQHPMRGLVGGWRVLAFTAMVAVANQRVEEKEGRCRLEVWAGQGGQRLRSRGWGRGACPCFPGTSFSEFLPRVAILRRLSTSEAAWTSLGPEKGSREHRA